MITNHSKIIDRARVMLNNKWGYIYGYKYKDNPVNFPKITSLRAQHSQVFTDAYYKLAIAQLGNNAIDCSGLVCRAYGIPDIGTWGMKELQFGSTGWKIDLITKLDSAIHTGAILWKSGHCGIYVGDSKVIEAKGINYGVCESKVGNCGFTHIIYNIAVSTSIHSEYARTGWIQEPDGRWWYAYDKAQGSYYKNVVERIGNAYYAFDDNGYLLKNALLYTDSDGALSFFGVSGEAYRS